MLDWMRQIFLVHVIEPFAIIVSIGSNHKSNHTHIHFRMEKIVTHHFPAQSDWLCALSVSSMQSLSHWTASQVKLKNVGITIRVHMSYSLRLMLIVMAHFLAEVRQSMISCRRTQTLPLDYLKALRSHQLYLRSLLPHLDPPVSPSDSQIGYTSESIIADEFTSVPSLGPLPNGIPDRTTVPYIPRHFPSFPSKHTYKATPEFTSREADPKRIREHATEEGRLGEEALRRLVSAGAGMRESTTKAASLAVSGRLRRRREAVWKETLEAVVTGSNSEQGKQVITHPANMEIDGPPSSKIIDNGLGGSVVNADSIYWRKVPSKPNVNPDELLRASPNM